MILITGGTVLTAAGPRLADVKIEDDRVVEIGENVGADGSGDAEIIDATNCWIGPGLVDLHVHLREPGQEWKEDIASGARAAATGGFTAVVAMPNTEPAIDAGHRADFVAQQGRRAGLCEVVPAGAITLGRSGEELAHLEELWDAGVRLFTDDGDTVHDAGLLRRAMEYLSDRPAVIAQHAEDAGLAAGGHMHEGAISSRLGMDGLPSLAEEVIVSRDIALVRLTGAAYHVQHVSTAGTVELVAAAKAEGLPVTAEVTPHHLLLDHSEVERLDPDFKMYPPLRTATDVAAVCDALRAGIIDAVATDHAPHADYEQEVPFEEAPRGVIGLETALAATLTALGDDMALLFDRMSTAPARIGHLADHGHPLRVGGSANIVVIDPTAPANTDTFVSRSQNSPFRGRPLNGTVVATIYRGTITHRHAPLAPMSTP